MGNSKCTYNLVDIVRLPLIEGYPKCISSSILPEKIILKSYYSINLIIFDPYMNAHLALLKIAINLHFEGCVFYQIRSVTQSCLTLCDPMNRSMPGLPVHHQLPEFTQTHVHRVSDAIQPSHPLSSPSSPSFNLSQHQGLFK